MRYVIDKDNFAVSIYQDGENVPFWFQPDYPNYDKFESYEEAENWAKLAILSHDENYEFFPPDGKNLPQKRKMTEAEKLEAKIKRESLN